MKNLSRATIILFFLLFLSLIPIKLVLAENLLIVEVQIAGEKKEHDFIKIYNPTDSDIYLGNYQDSYIRLVKRTKTAIKDTSIKSWSKEPEAKIPAGGFYLWANKNYTTLSNVNVSTSQTIVANNGIALRLGPENTGAIIDAVGWGDFNNVLFEGKPFPENPASNQKLERKKISQTYQDTNNNANDFELNPASKPKTETLPKEEPQPETQMEPQPEAELKSLEEPKPIIYPLGVIINEILPDPEGISDTEGEYIEIFNKNSFEVDLSGWKITDTIGKPTIYTFPKGKTINPGRFLILFWPETKITLNNLDGDSLKLIQPDGTIIDEVNYEKAIKGQSYNRTDSGWVWSTILTLGSENIVLIQKTEETESLEEAGEIDINTAPLEDLVKIVHIGKTKAQELVSLRPFYSLDDLARIRGIGEKALEDIKRQGLAWVDPKLEPPKIEKTEPLEKGLAAVAEPFKPFNFAQGKQIPKSLIVFLIALALAIFLGIIILILKKRLKTKQLL